MAQWPKPASLRVRRLRSERATQGALLVRWPDSGVLGEPELATVEKSKAACEEAMKQLVEFVNDFYPPGPT